MAVKIGYGIDIGEHSIKLVKLTKGKECIRLAAVRTVRSKITSSDNSEKREEKAANAIRELVDSIKIEESATVTVATPGLSAFIRYIKLPPVTSKRLQQIIGYEAQQQVPFPLNEVTWDYQLLEMAGQTETSVVLVAIKSDVVTNLLGTIKSLNIEPSVIEYRPLGLYNCVNFNKEIEPDRITVIIDIGARATDMTIEREGQPCWTRSARIGSGDITESIKKALNIGFEEAERLKIEKGEVYLNEDDENSADEESSRIWHAINPNISEIITELQRSVSYFHSQLEGGKIDRILLTGGGSKLRNFRSLIGQQLNAEVEMLDPFENIAYENEILGGNEFKPELSVAVGLALRSLGGGFSKINLLPKEVISSRELRKKKAYLVLSGLSLALLLAISVVFANDRYHLINLKLENVKSELKNFEGFAAKIKEVTRDHDKYSKKIDIFKNLLAQRDYWPNILLELGKVLPDNAYFRKFSIVDKKENLIELCGITTDYDAVGNILKRFEISPSVVSVEVISAKPVEKIAGSRKKDEDRGSARRGRRGGVQRKKEPEIEEFFPAGIVEKPTGIDFVLQVKLKK